MLYFHRCYPWFIRLFALSSIILSFLFIQFISFVNDDNLHSVSIESVMGRLQAMDIFWLLQLPEFITISTQLNDWHWHDISMFLSPYSAVSLTIFTLGLYAYQRSVGHLKFSHIPGYFMLMGLLHLLLAKGILLIDLPNTLTGPVLSVGILGISYFAIAALVSDWYLNHKSRQLT